MVCKSEVLLINFWVTRRGGEGCLSLTVWARGRELNPGHLRDARRRTPPPKSSAITDTDCLHLLTTGQTVSAQSRRLSQ